MPRVVSPPAAPPAAEPGSTVVVQEKVLAEISHELGNFFHKLYYWSDYLKEDGGRRSVDSSAGEMLERTIKNLEDFLKIALGYFDPVQLSAVRMKVSDVVDGLLYQLRSQLNGTPLDVGPVGAWEGTQVMVDPGQLSRAFEIAVRHLATQAGTESRLEVSIERNVRRDCPGLEVDFTLHRPAESSPLFRTAEAGVEWAVAQRVLVLHGGELGEYVHEGGEKHVVIFLPLQPVIEV